MCVSMPVHVCAYISANGCVRVCVLLHLPKCVWLCDFAQLVYVRVSSSLLDCTMRLCPCGCPRQGTLFNASREESMGMRVSRPQLLNVS